MTELRKIIMLLREAVGELDQWSVDNDDQYNEEVAKILEIIYRMEK